MRSQRGIPLVVLCVALAGCGDADPRAVLSGEAFGARYHITLPGSHPEAQIVHQHIAGLFNAIDEQASAWRDESWVSKFNRGRSLEPVEVPEHAWAMLVVAERVAQESGGAFDVTAGPLVELWGFGANPGTAPSQPSEMQIAVALTNTGMNKLVLDHQAKTVAKRSPGVTIDLSALAKGYAVDGIAAILEEHGHERYLIEFGGEVLGKDLSTTGEGWVIEIEDGTGAPTNRRITLRNHAVATSGTGQRQRVLSDGRVVSHLIDPRTGQPIDDPLRSVTVIAGSCVLADAWATALAVDRSPEAVEAAAHAGAEWLRE